MVDLSPFFYPIEWLAVIAAVTFAILMVSKHGVAKILRATAWFLWKLASAYEHAKTGFWFGFRSVEGNQG